MGNWYLPNGLVYREGQLKSESVLILDGLVMAFGREADELRNAFEGSIKDCDAQNKIVTRGFIDLHVHLREPGFETKETILTGTQAAAAGGFTDVCAMPNTDPPLDTVERLNDLQERIAKNAQVKVHPIATLTRGRLGQSMVNYKEFRERGILFFSDDGNPLEQYIAKEVFLEVQKVGGIVINHLEDKSLIQEGFFYKHIPPESEYLMLERDLIYARGTGCRYHAAHLSCAESVELVAQAKTQGLSVTAEVTPHHLTLISKDIREPKGHFQMKPPLRTERDRESLIDGLRTGVIACVATDHAPHGREKEQGLYEGSPFGVTGLETAFPILYTNLVLTQQLSLERLLASLTSSPAQLLGVTPELTLGAKADLVVLDLNLAKTVGAQGFKSKGTNSPYTGQVLQGWPVLTLVDGEERYSCK